MTDARITAEKLLQAEAVRLSPQQPFTWASGWKSPIYCDNRKLLSLPFVRDYIKSELCNTVFEQFPDADLIAGVATAGIAWGALVADQLKLPFVYVRAKAKEHGLGNQIEGSYAKGQRVVVVEDLISTGKSSLEVVKVLESAGVEIEGIVAIFSYGFEAAESAFETAGIPYRTLTNYENLIALAEEKGQVTTEQGGILLNWRKDPANWTGVA
jgi:orotate phosphoribosyltransferase